ncbi:MAG: hypothetical protein MZW92_63315 [Comamonadaceae bacterium]|nr:hypothetical protein [Comamonadaceae bacterium]
MLPIPESRIVKKWRLQPGKMFLIDLEQGRIVDDEELKNQFANAKPVPAVDRATCACRLDDLPAPARPAPRASTSRCSTASRPSATRRRTSSS